MKAEELSQADFAERIGLSTRHIRSLVLEGLPIKSRKGKVTYPWAECLRWYLEHKIAAAVEQVAPADFEEARARKMAAEAEKAELELAQLRRRLVTVDDYQAELAVILGRLRAALIALPGKYAPHVEGLTTTAEAQAAIERMVNEVLGALQHVTLDEEPGLHAA